MLDFGRAQKMGKSIVVLGVNPQKQPLVIAVLCAERLFNFTGAGSRWNDWNKPAIIHEAKIIADVCNFIWAPEEVLQAFVADLAEGDGLGPWGGTMSPALRGSGDFFSSETTG